MTDMRFIGRSYSVGNVEARSRDALQDRGWASHVLWRLDGLTDDSGLALTGRHDDDRRAFSCSDGSQLQ